MTEQKCNTWSFSSQSGVKRRAKIRRSGGGETETWNMKRERWAEFTWEERRGGTFQKGQREKAGMGGRPVCPEDLAEACLTVMRAQPTICRSRGTPAGAKQQRKPHLLNHCLLAATAQPWGHGREPSCCCQGRSPGWLTARPPSPGSSWRPWPLWAPATTDQARLCIASLFYFCKPEILRFTLRSVNWCTLVGGKAPQLGQSWGSGPSEADQQKPRDPTAVPSLRPVLHLVGSGLRPSIAIPCFATAGVVTRNPKELTGSLAFRSTGPLS